MLAAPIEALEAAAVWFDRENLIRGPRRTLSAAVRRMFRRQERLFLKRLAALAATRVDEAASEAQIVAALEAFTESEIMRELDIVLEETQGDILDVTIDAGDAAIVAGGTVVLEQIDADVVFTFNRNQERNLEYLRRNAALLVTRVSDTTRRRMRTLIVSMLEQGLGRNDIEREIRSRFRDMRTPKPQRHIRDRADLITVTELGQGFEQGGRTVAQDLERGGIPIEKRWLTSQDDRVSDGCRENGAVGYIPERDTFPSGHLAPLRFPGCRCTTVRRVADL